MWRCPKISISPTDIYLINNKYGNENIFTIYCIREAVKNVLALRGYPPTMGENHSFWLLKRFLIFQGISGDLDANLLKHISLKIQ